MKSAANLVAMRFEVELKAPSKAPALGRILLRALSFEGEPQIAEPLAIAVGPEIRELSISLPHETRWEVSAELAGFWLEPRQFIARQGADVQALALWPLGRVRGTLVRAAGETAWPKTITLTSLPARESQGAANRPRGQLLCPIDPRGRFECELPATKFDFALSVPGYVPQYVWSAPVSAGATLDLGPLRLVRGGSIAGWLVVPSGALDANACSVRLLPSTLPGGDLAKAEKDRSAALEARPLPSGFFQLRGVKEGLYVLEVDQPGFARTSSLPIRILDREEVVLPAPLELKRPFKLTLTLDPPFDPFERPWRIRLTRNKNLAGGPDREIVFEDSATTSGQLEIENLASGNYDLTAIDSQGAGLALERALRFDGAGDLNHVFAIRWIEVVGNVTLGGEPLPATLWFGGERGALRRSARSDAEGNFEVTLPRIEDTVVEVSAETPALHLLRKLRIERGPNNRARVNLAIEDHRVFGRVVDEAGNSVADVEVVLSTDEEFPQVTATGSDGSFSFRGISRGAYQLGATSEGPSFAEPLEINISANAVTSDSQSREFGPVELRLKRGQIVAGTVLTNHGPAVGAAIDVFTLAPLPGFAVKTRTYARGTFSLDLPAGAERLLVVVSSPGDALTSFVVSKGDLVRPLVISDDHGTLHLEGEAILTSRWTLARDGIEIPRPLLEHWAARHGAERTANENSAEFPALAVGDYRFCFQRDSERAPECAHGFLHSGGTLTLGTRSPTRNAELRLDPVSRP